MPVSNKKHFSDVCDAFAVFKEAYFHVQQSIPNTRLLRIGKIDYLQYGEPIEQAEYEFLVCEIEPLEAVKPILRKFSNTPHWLTMTSLQAESVWALLAPFGYEPHEREYLMTFALNQSLPKDTSEWQIVRVETAEQVQQINELRNRQAITPAQLTDPQIQVYCIQDGQSVVCYGQMVLASRQKAYIANVFTHPYYRNQGMAAAMMEKMLQDAACKDAAEVVLLSSQAGHSLYQKLGFKDLSQVAILFYPGRQHSETAKS